MNSKYKLISELTPQDFDTYPVWEYADDDSLLETALFPVVKSPVQSLAGRIVGVQVNLAGGIQIGAILGNIDLRDEISTKHFLTLSVYRNGKWFTLARYHDVFYKRTGPEALAKFLGLELNVVFPMSYNITDYCIGNETVLVNTIDAEPTEILSSAELMNLAVPKRT